MTTSNNKCFSPSEAAALLGVHPQTIRNWIQQGILTATKIKTRLFIKADDLNELLKKNKTL